MSTDTLNTSAPGETEPRESRTAQFYQATDPDPHAPAILHGHYPESAEWNAEFAKTRHARLQAYADSQWAKPPVGEDDGQEYRESRSWRDNPLYSTH